MSAGSATLVAREVSKSFGSRVVLDRVSVRIGPRTRLGIVAPNGTGKSTLLRLLAGIDTPDAGSIVLAPSSATVGYLPQEPDRSATETVHDYLARRTSVAAAEAAFAAASDALARGADGADDAYAVALDQYLALGAADFESRVGEVCADLALPADVVDLPTGALSGGQAARVSLAAILLARFDIFLLDEPTNDLDFAGLERLEWFLDDLPGGVVIVSHDRAFLDRTIDEVLELDEHSHQGALYAGGWSAYVDERATARRHAEEAYAGYQAERATLRQRAQRQRQWAQQGVKKVKKSGETDKFIRHFNTQSSQHVAAKAKITDKALERLESRAVAKPWEGWELRMTIESSGRSGSVVGRLVGAVVRRGSFTLGPIDLEISAGERVAILGANGSGKSTLLQALLGRLPVDEGEARLGSGIVLGELGQARARFDDAPDLLQGFVAASGLLARDARSLLAKFGLGVEHVGRPARVLSPGERTRAELALLVARGVNTLVLDEPTNHLDLPAIEQLEQALETFTGTVLLVTHDRAFLGAVATTRVIELDDGQIVGDHVTDLG
ncbi:MAG TPA: ABC-F family ATP-binding cassette domain-containing protein [Acidimicrobiia bacterium]|nr:ABC-F family ATP-binding cassette domain-containing protein [Acidimicrobiia bacterium]